MNLYISDLHFSHKNILRFDNRPYSNVKEMEDGIITNWNSVVTSKDTVYHLGDFTMAPYIEGASYKDRYINIANELLDKLNGKKYLIRGNHDPRKGILEHCYFEDTFREIELNGFLLTQINFALSLL